MVCQLGAGRGGLGRDARGRGVGRVGDAAGRGVTRGWRWFGGIAETVTS